MQLALDSRRLSLLRPQPVVLLAEAKTLKKHADLPSSVAMATAAEALISAWRSDRYVAFVDEVLLNTERALVERLRHAAGVPAAAEVSVKYGGWARQAVISDFLILRDSSSTSIDHVFAARLWPGGELALWRNALLGWHKRLANAASQDIHERHLQMRLGLGKNLQAFYQATRATVPAQERSIHDSTDLTEQKAPVTDPDLRTVTAKTDIEETDQTPTESPAQHILAIGTEWASGHGGLSTFNRSLCASLAALGHRVVCLVATATDADVRDAEALGVEVIRPPFAFGISPEAALLRRPLLPEGFKPQVIIGHGRHTGAAAMVQQEDHFPGSQRIHFVHVAPGDIEWPKSHLQRQSGQDADAEEKATERESIEVALAAGATLVAGVGPRLTGEITRLLQRLADMPTIHRFDPGLSERVLNRQPPKQLSCLLFGRVEDFTLKGVDIAAGAFDLLPQAIHDQLRPTLEVRGAKRGQSDETKQAILDCMASKDRRVRVLDYTTDASAIRGDIRAATAVMVPSRAEGFGLVGLEAIGGGTPTLISGKSGLGDLIVEINAKLAEYFVVPVTDDFREDCRRWAERLRYLLEHPEEAFDRVRELQSAIQSHTTNLRAAKQLMAALAAAASSEGKRSASPSPDLRARR
jgi:glycosyltransferase involved in cell wall biosynthesis